MLNVENTCILWRGTDTNAHVFKNKIFLECHVVNGIYVVLKVITSVLLNCVSKGVSGLAQSLSR